MISASEIMGRHGVSGPLPHDPAPVLAHQLQDGHDAPRHHKVLGIPWVNRMSERPPEIKMMLTVTALHYYSYRDYYWIIFIIWQLRHSRDTPMFTNESILPHHSERLLLQSLNIWFYHTLMQYIHLISNQQRGRNWRLTLPITYSKLFTHTAFAPIP